MVPHTNWSVQQVQGDQCDRWLQPLECPQPSARLHSRTSSDACSCSRFCSDGGLDLLANGHDSDSGAATFYCGTGTQCVDALCPPCTDRTRRPAAVATDAASRHTVPCCHHRCRRRCRRRRRRRHTRCAKSWASTATARWTYSFRHRERGVSSHERLLSHDLLLLP